MEITLKRLNKATGEIDVFSDCIVHKESPSFPYENISNCVFVCVALVSMEGGFQSP